MWRRSAVRKGASAVPLILVSVRRENLSRVRALLAPQKVRRERCRVTSRFASRRSTAAWHSSA
eukprot:scaffold922_cov327-Pinguiococcus_pyrenoidosus.AAC.32